MTRQDNEIKDELEKIEMYQIDDKEYNRQFSLLHDDLPQNIKNIQE